jgi:membrane-bound lytic murein transglycosylase D
MSFQQRTQLANTSTTPSGTPFRRRRLAVLITTTLLLHACSTLPGGSDGGHEEVVDESSASQSRWNVSRHARGTPMPRHAVSSSTPDEVLADTPTGLWQRIGEGFSFALEHEHSTVSEAIDYYAGNEDFMQQVAERARPFLFLILEEIEARGLPTELALLPIVESAYNPNAVSRQNAVGLWQFMATTATGMGLTDDWWYDARRDPLASTTAALDYLEVLHELFNNDWLLALAAYNLGQGNLQRAIKRNEEAGLPTDFWSLQLPAETTRHVPRVLALAHLISDPERHGLHLTPIPNQPYLAVIDAEVQVNLATVAEMAGLQPELVYRLNPGYRQWATHPDGPHMIALPMEYAERFQNGLASLSNEQQHVTWDRYVIQPGDTLGGIASRYRTRVAALQSVNNLRDSRIVAGDTLLIPRAYVEGQLLTPPDVPVYASDSGTRMTASTHQVRSGDSLWRIANQHQMSVDDLMQWNNLNGNTVLRPGQTLRLQAPTVAALGGSQAQASLSAGTPALRAARAAAEVAREYEVRPGDSLIRIATEHNTTVEALMELNNLRRSELIHPGQQLIIPADENN